MFSNHKKKGNKKSIVSERDLERDKEAETEAKVMPKGMGPEVHGQAGAGKSVKRISGG